MAQAVLQDDPVVDLKERQMSSAVNAQKKVEEEVLTRQQVQDFLISERARVRFCGTLPLTVCIWFVFTATAWSHGNVEQTARAQSMIRDAIEGIEVQHQISSLQGQPVAKRTDSISGLLLSLYPGLLEQHRVQLSLSMKHYETRSHRQLFSCVIVSDLSHMHRAQAMLSFSVCFSAGVCASSVCIGHVNCGIRNGSKQ
ncbi:PKD2 [Symbiodinium sp. CCMP2592]|nr:PKD2 [Symbiodinium sp. CCMP2592]